MMYAITGQSASGCSTNYLLKIQHSPAYRLTSASFTPPPPRSKLQQFVDGVVRLLSQKGQP